MTAAKGQGAETRQRAIGGPGATRLPMPHLGAHTRLKHRRRCKPGSPLSQAMTKKSVTHVVQHGSSFSRRVAPES
jgi:hypothetical protein